MGSGIGKGILAGALSHEFDEVIGIEILEGLHQKSLELKENYYSAMTKVLKIIDNPFHYSSIPEMKLIHGDFYDVSSFDASSTGLLPILFFATPHVSKKNLWSKY